MVGGWQGEVWWEQPRRGDTPSPVRPDMNDPGLTFQLLKPAAGNEDLENAAALVLPAMPKVQGPLRPPRRPILPPALLYNL